jgi:PAS domain S-box-containing protein
MTATIEGPFLLEILDHVAHAVFVKDRAFRYVFLNRAVCELVGRSHEAMIGKTDYEIFSKSEADQFRAKDTEMFEREQEVVIDEEAVTDSGGGRHIIATTKVPLRDRDGRITHVVGIVHDITRLKRAEEALRQANAELERRVEERGRALAEAQADLHRKERLAVLGRLAGGVAHEIRNPLAAIRAAAQIIERACGARGANAVEALGIIREEVARADRIIGDLIDYARVRPPSRRRIALGYVVDQALGAQVVPPGVTIDAHLPELPDLDIDPDQLQVAFANIMRNALEAMGPVGRLTVTARVEEGCAVVVSVTDTGPGLTDEVRGRLFEPLLTTKPHGLGLGLVTARSLVENHGGELRHVARGVGNDEGDDHGATFEVRLPLSPADSPTTCAT